jgi:hypothetical protein
VLAIGMPSFRMSGSQTPELTESLEIIHGEFITQKVKHDILHMELSISRVPQSSAYLKNTSGGQVSNAENRNKMRKLRVSVLNLFMRLIGLLRG